MPLDRSIDPRILVSDEDRLVLVVHSPGGRLTWRFAAAVAALSALVAAAAFFLIGRFSVVSATLLGFAITFSAVATFLTRTVLVALRDQDVLFFETTNTLWKSRRRRPIGRLSDLDRFEIRTFLETETNIAPTQVYELTAGGKALWYAASREVADLVGAELLRLARSASR